MILIINEQNRKDYPDLLDKMYRLRTRIFHDHLGWNVSVKDGLERDIYDDLAPTYLIYTDDKAQEILGSLRLMPMTGPTLLNNVFKDTLPADRNFCRPEIWECTRICIDDKLLKSGNKEDIQFAFITLVTAMGEFGLKNNIEGILGNLDKLMLRLYKRIGCEVEIVGSTQSFGSPVYLGLFIISQANLDNVLTRINNPLSSTSYK